MPHPHPARPARGVHSPIPVPGETTASWWRRLATRYRMPCATLLRAVLAIPGEPAALGRPRSRAELFLNAPARERMAHFTGLSPDRLTAQLPAWNDHPHPATPPSQLPAAHWQSIPHNAPLQPLPGCRQCTAPRAGTALVWQYRAHHERLCSTHRIWLLGPHQPTQISVASLDDIHKAHQQHRQLLQRSPIAATAYTWARNIVQRAYELTELLPTRPRTWEERTTRLAAQGDHALPWHILGRDIINYPETIAVTGTLLHLSATPRTHTMPEQSLVDVFTAQLKDHLSRCPPLIPHLAETARSDLHRWHQHTDANPHQPATPPPSPLPLATALDRHQPGLGATLADTAWPTP